MKKYRRVIFLDIDGVLQPDSNRDRFNHNLIQLRQEIAEKYNDENYMMLDEWDIGAVYYDWSEKAVENLRSLLNIENIEIVISSSWKYKKTVYDLQCLFRIHNLEYMVTDMTPQDKYGFTPNKNVSINEYLEKNNDILTYVVIDDADLSKYYPNNFVCTKKEDYLDDESTASARKILETTEI